MNQEQIIQMQMIEQEAGQLNEQLQIIEQNVKEMTNLNESLEELESKKEGEEMLVNIGKRIYLPVNIKEKGLIVEVGKGNLVKKNVAETKGVVDEQIKRLGEARVEIMNRLGELQQEMMKMMNAAQEEQVKEKKE